MFVFLVSVLMIIANSIEMQVMTSILFYVTNLMLSLDPDLTRTS